MKKRYSYMVVYIHQDGEGRAELTLNKKIKTYADIEACDNIIRNSISNNGVSTINEFVVDYKYLGRVK